MQDLLTGETRVTPEMAVRQDILTENKESSVREDEKWEEHRYEEVGDIIGGGTPDTSKDDYWGGKVQWAVPSEVTDRPEVELEDTERKLTEEGLNNTSAKVLPETSVLMTSRATVGVPVINRVPMATNQGFQSFDVSESDIVNPYYLYYQIEENADYIDSIANGGTFDEISKSELAKLRVNIPPLWEQERIASLLYTVDEMIARTSDLIDEYERLKRGLMQDLLSGDVRTPEDLSVLDEIKLDADSAGADGSSVTQSTIDV
jgi:type I restriction enzyme S subunit